MAEIKRKIPYVSSIKIKGIHLLPPVITQKRRAELQGYKQQAIKLEKRLHNCKELQKNLEDLLNMHPLTDRPFSEISFQSNGHIEALGIPEKPINHQSKPKRREIRLTTDIVDVTQYDNDGIKVIYNDAYQYVLPENNLSDYSNNTQEIDRDTHFTKLSNTEPQLQNDNNQEINNFKSSVSSHSCKKVKILTKCPSENRCIKDESFSIEQSSKPRLIRSNSYTLETPSPILLAHLEKIESNKKDELRNSDETKHLIARDWASLENNYTPFENSEFSSMNTVYNTNTDPDDIKSSTPIDKKPDDTERSSSPTIKVIQTDISVQKITVNTNNDIFNDVTDENCETSNTQLLKLLRTLPDIYAKPIIDLIESQKLEKHNTVNREEESKLNSYEHSDQVPKNDKARTINGNHAENNANEDSHKSLITMNLKNEDQSNLHQKASLSACENLENSSTSISPSQSIYYSVTSCNTLRPLSNSSIRLIDFECDDSVAFEDNSDSSKKTDITEYYINQELKKGINVSRKLFPETDGNVINNIKQEWAASIIGAHVKGYLTRRLLKTERVQSLIETIKDALMCALELHNADNIDESDVELHRRLINQVSAACYTFHDIFFSLSVQEQMLIIATDRQRKLEKAKRPASAPNTDRSKSSSTRSTPRQRVPSHSRSLTKV